jgi:hypothetical protein
MRDCYSELRAKLAKAIEAVILPIDPTTAIGDAAQEVVLALMRATEIDETDYAADRRLALDILTPQGNDDYRSHAAKLREAERRQAALTLFRLYASIGSGSGRATSRLVSSRHRCVGEVRSSPMPATLRSR